MVLSAALELSICSIDFSVVFSAAVLKIAYEFYSFFNPFHGRALHPSCIWAKVGYTPK